MAEKLRSHLSRLTLRMLLRVRSTEYRVDERRKNNGGERKQWLLMLFFQLMAAHHCSSRWPHFKDEACHSSLTWEMGLRAITCRGPGVMIDERVGLESWIWCSAEQASATRDWSNEAGTPVD